MAAAVALALAPLASISSVASEAAAFVPPRFRAARARARILGNWRVITMREKFGGSIVPPEAIFVHFEPTLVHRAFGKGPEDVGSAYEVLEEDDVSATLLVHLSPTKSYRVEVLVESNDAISLFVSDLPSEGDEVVFRFERVR